MNINTSYLPLVFALILLILTSFTPGVGHHQSANLDISETPLAPSNNYLTAASPEVFGNRNGGDKVLPDSYSPPPKESASEGLKNSSVFSLPPINTYPLRDWGVLDPKVDVAAALVKDLDSGYIFWNKDSSHRWPIASLTKLMTAIVALEQLDTSKEIIVSQNAVTVAGGAGDLKINGSYKIDDLLKIMLLASSNNAATALAEAYFSSEEFVKVMQTKARELGMSQTTLFDPTGLSVSNQSNSNDLAMLANYILKNHPEIFKITTQKNYKDIKNINLFAGRPDFLGGKTGFLEEAGGNLISIFKYKDGKFNFPLLIVVLGSKDRFNDTQVLLDWIKEAYSFK